MNIGFYLLDVNANNQQHQTILKALNELCISRPYDNIILFNNKFDTIDINQKYYILHISEAKYFKGLLFVFDVRSAMLTKTFPTPKKQLLYVNQPEWAKKRDIPYSFWSSIYNNPDFELITSNDDLQELCDICWKKPLSNIDDFNGESVNQIINKLNLE